MRFGVRALLFYLIRQRASQLRREKKPSRHDFSHMAPLVGIRHLSKSNCTKKLNCIHRFNKGAEATQRPRSQQLHLRVRLSLGVCQTQRAEAFQSQTAGRAKPPSAPPPSPRGPDPGGRPKTLGLVGTVAIADVIARPRRFCER